MLVRWRVPRRGIAAPFRFLSDSLLTLTRYDIVRAALEARPRRWLITGVAGFIGSNLLQHLLELGQAVVGMDNFATGFRSNLEEVLDGVGPARRNFRFVEGDIRDLVSCEAACEGVEFVLHHAALGSVPRSLADPLATNQTNIDGFLNMVAAARDAGVRRFVYAASSSTYGDHPGLPKVEDTIGRPLSPYAVTKYVNELYAGVFQRNYGLETIGLRYFNVFGPRQDPHGAYAAVIPRWIGNLLAGVPCQINGDGETSRDFSYVANVLQANLLAATAEDPEATDQVYNVALGARTSLNELFYLIRDSLAAVRPEFREVEPVYVDFRQGDVRHSQADIGKIGSRLGYAATHSVEQGMQETLAWYLRTLERGAGSAAVALGSP
jgi:UDP-N-acetylglucosamine/UDP-N-acetylgalactosamine 4-epimerase